VRAVFDAQNKAILTGTTFANLLESEVNEVRTSSCLNICGLLLTTTSYIVVFIPLHMLFELPCIQRRSSMVDTVKIEAWTGLFHTPTFQYDSEALGECEALETLSTELYVIKDLAIDGLLNKRRREGTNAGFDFCTEMSRTIGVGGPFGGHSERKNEQEVTETQHQEILSQNTIGKRQRGQITNSSQMAEFWTMARIVRTNYYCGVLPRPNDLPRIKGRMDLCRMDLFEWTAPRTFRPEISSRSERRKMEYVINELLP